MLGLEQQVGRQPGKDGEIIDELRLCGRMAIMHMGRTVALTKLPLLVGREEPQTLSF